MNVLITASDNDKASGAFRSMVRLAYYLRSELGTNAYILLSRPGDGSELLDQYHIPYYMVRSYNWIMGISDSTSLVPNAKWRLKRRLNQIAIHKVCMLINELDIDIIHLNTTWTYIGAAAAQKCAKPYAWHIREFLEEDQNVRFADKKYAVNLLNHADKIICISKSIYNKYSTILDKRRMDVVYNGLEPSIYSGREKTPFMRETLEFLIVGTVCESKGQWLLIEACGKLLQRGFNNFHVRILGKGKREYIASLKEKAEEKGLEGQIEFCGYRDNTPDYYKNADITFVCSKSEAFGRVTVEAMMSGSLVIGADAAATLELIENKKTGLLYKSEDVNQLAEAIEWAVNNREQSIQIAQNGKKFMLDNGSAFHNAKNIHELYCNMLQAEKERE